MNANTYYRQAIDIIVANQLNYEDLGVALAKENPALFVKLVAQQKDVDVPGVEQWQRDVYSHIIGGNMVNAIKLTREKTGFGLKEAKDVCDAVRYTLIANKRMSKPDHDLWVTSAPVHLLPDLRAIHDRIAKAYG